MLSQQPSLLRIGALKAQSNVPIKTIRYYEELGLIQSAKRTEGGFRLFSPDVLHRLTFIKRAQSLGLSLQEIGEILAIHDQGELPCVEVRHKFAAKITEIDHKIEQLALLKAQLQSLIDQVSLPPKQMEGLICPIIEQL